MVVGLTLLFCLPSLEIVELTNAKWLTDDAVHGAEVTYLGDAGKIL